MFRIIAFTEEAHTPEVLVCEAASLKMLARKFGFQKTEDHIDWIENRFGVDCLQLEWPLDEKACDHDDDIWIDYERHNLDGALQRGEIERQHYKALRGITG